MKPKDPQLLDVLNDILSAELTAINQYFLHAKMCKNWGYKRLHKHIREESIDEMKHAERITERILFLEGVPNLQRLYTLNIGETVPEQLQSDLSLEYTAVERLNKAIQRCLEIQDAGTRELLEHILVEEEEHIDWLETQLTTIQQIGLPAYLSQQLEE